MPKIRLRGPWTGIREDVDLNRIGPHEAEDCLNLDLSSGTLRRRPGYEVSSFATPGKCFIGSYEFINTNGDYFRFVKLRGITHSTSGEFEGFKSGAAWTIVGTDTIHGAGGLKSESLPDFLELGNRVYMVDGSPNLGLVVDDTLTFAMYMNAPQTPVAANSVVVGVLGEEWYSYKLTFYSTDWGQESASSPASFSTQADPGNPRKIDVTSISSALSDARADKIRIYRRNESTSEVHWTYVDEVNIGTISYVDNTPDSSRDLSLIAPSSIALEPDISLIAYQDGVTFGSGDADNPKRIYYTRSGQPWAWDGFLDSTASKESVTGLRSYQGQLFVFKRQSIWALTGNTQETFSLVKIFGGVGAVNQQAIVEADGFLYFLGEGDFYRWDGASRPEPISAEVQGTVSSREFVSDRSAICGYDPIRQTILLSFTSLGSAEVNDKTLAYFPTNSRKGRNSWCPWQFMGAGDVQDYPVSYQLWRDTTGDRVPHMIIGLRNSGSVGRLTDNATDSYSTAVGDGVDIPVKWRTGKLDGGVQELYKKWGEVEVELADAVGGGVALNLNYRVDSEGSSTTLKALAFADEVLRSRVGRSSRDIRIEFDGTVDESQFEVYSINVNAELAGRSP